jgi:hypothetical protein
MSEKDNGGPAFPVGFQHGESIAMKGGMALRDYFAAKAMQGFAADSNMGVVQAEEIAELAYLWADAMLKERAK